jgi:hypothetical protein
MKNNWAVKEKNKYSNGGLKRSYTRYFKMKLLILSLLLALTMTGLSQSTSPYVIITTLGSQMDKKYPMLDSLFPLRKINLKEKEWDSLSKKDKRTIKREISTAQGYKLDSDSLQGYKLLAALPVFQGFSNFDSAASKRIEQNQPFYMISTPVFLDDSKKCIVLVSLIRGFGYSYILERKNYKRIILRSIYGWM